MTNTSNLADLFGPVFGTGPGAGMSLLLFCAGLGVALTGFSGYFIRSIRAAEDLLPDYTQHAQVEYK